MCLHSPHTVTHNYSINATVTVVINEKQHIGSLWCMNYFCGGKQIPTFFFSQIILHLISNIHIEMSLHQHYDKLDNKVIIHLSSHLPPLIQGWMDGTTLLIMMVITKCNPLTNRSEKSFKNNIKKQSNIVISRSVSYTSVKIKVAESQLYTGMARHFSCVTDSIWLWHSSCHRLIHFNCLILMILAAMLTLTKTDQFSWLVSLCASGPVN